MEESRKRWGKKVETQPKSRQSLFLSFFFFFFEPESAQFLSMKLRVE